MKACEATIIIPTTGDRGELLRYSVGSVLNQTVRDLEIRIVGDGVSRAARDAILALKAQDSRIFFHDFPKHERRGEPYRHQVIQESHGRTIFYLCDRDLMLPNHVEMVSGLLRKHDFVCTTFIDVKKNGSLNIEQWHVVSFGPGPTVSGNLSCVGHTRAMYDRLEFGWRTTPIDRYTDGYMWEQFAAHPACRAYTAVMPTILYFKRGDHPGDPVEERARELAAWSERISTQKGIENIFWKAFGGMFLERHSLRSFRTSVVRLLRKP